MFHGLFLRLPPPVRVLSLSHLTVQAVDSFEPSYPRLIVQITSCFQLNPGRFFFLLDRVYMYGVVVGHAGIKRGEDSSSSSSNRNQNNAGVTASKQHT